MDVIVAEELSLLRDGLVALLVAGLQGCSVRGAATLEMAAGAVARGVPGSPSILLLDRGLLGPSGPEGIRTFRARLPQAAIVVLAAREDRDDVLRCLAAGARGYVGKTAGAAELLRAVSIVASGGVHVPPGLADAGPGVEAVRTAPGAAPRGMPGQLTGRQRDVLLLMAEGRSTKDIARTLDLAVSTIKVHLAAVYRTVGARNRVEALCRAGLLPREQAFS